jgi:hypothetical protein
MSEVRHTSWALLAVSAFVPFVHITAASHDLVLEIQERDTNDMGNHSIFYDDESKKKFEDEDGWLKPGLYLFEGIREVDDGDVEYQGALRVLTGNQYLLQLAKHEAEDPNQGAPHGEDEDESDGEGDRDEYDDHDGSEQ